MPLVARRLPPSGHVRVLLVGLAFLAGGLVGPGEARALPRYAAAYGQDCNLCHHDPTGGGLRSAYATQYLVPAELVWRSDPESAAESIDPSIGDHLTVGADLRLLTTGSDDDADPSLFLTMQSDVHVVLQMDERTSVAIDVGNGRRSEAWGLARVLPWQGWLKAGRFVPAYGWRFADHQIYARRFLLNRDGERSPAAWEDSGVEVGVSPGSLQLSASVQTAGGEVGESWAVRAVERQSFGAVDLALGASALRRQRGDADRTAYGGFGAANLGPVTWLGQFDVVRAVDDRDEWILSQQIAWTVHRGWTLLFQHDVHDPDRDLAPGSRQRWGVGVDTLLTPFVGIQALARFEDPDPGPVVDEDEAVRGDVVLHFLF